MIKPPITKKMLADWAGAQVLRDAEILAERGLVQEVSYEPPFIRGSILWNNRTLATALKILPDGTVESECPCWANRERGIICAHVIALGVVLVKRATDPHREAKYQDELRRARHLASIREEEYVSRVPLDHPGAILAALRLTLDREWRAAWKTDAIPVTCEVEFKGERHPLDRVPRNLPLHFSREDEALLFVLEDICEGPAQGRFTVRRTDLLNLIRLLAGRSLWAGGETILINNVPLPTRLRMDLDRENGELILMAHTELPQLKAGEYPFHMVAGKRGWVFGAGNLWALENLLPDPYHALYEGPVCVPRRDVVRFLRHELSVLSQSARLESDISTDLFTIDPAIPAFRLLVRGSPASLSATLYAVYESLELIAGKPDPHGHFGIPDPDDLMRYTVRAVDAEKAALAILSQSGFSGECGDTLSSIVGTREVLNSLGGQLPALRRRGWRVQLEGRVTQQLDGMEFATPVVHISDAPGGRWFDVNFQFEDNHAVSLSHTEIRMALQKGDAYLQKAGRTILIDAEAVDSMSKLFADCATLDGSTPGAFRMSNIHAPFVKASLDALDGVDVEDTPAWRDTMARCNRIVPIEPVTIPPPLDTILRPYQKEGVDWLCYLEANGFCGILADEMGLGKTVQTLIWVYLLKHQQKEQTKDKPVLIVCPTSIVENWVEEARRFVPNVTVTALSGTDRHERWDSVRQTDLVVTSYALLRRDLDRYLDIRFSAVVLDEAQHIKNRSTQNAVAAKSLKADHRLVLTGTPIENSVSDLWSIMDFLMPGYMGSHDSFRNHYENPLGHGGPESEPARLRLRRKLHPFLLRRMKSAVARDLPPKIEKVSFCTLTGDQQRVYQALLDTSRRQLSSLVSKQGFNKSRMEILATLMRLRQVCCHLKLLDLPGLEPQYPSAKMDLFFELLDEAIDSEHRVLVFSQFVTMLSILREEMDRRGITYCYLDGSTKDRMTIVHRFNSQRDIPVFLISLKAGGTGLNLTGADMVIHFDPWWNPAVENQATDRAYRIGQKKTVFMTKLITKGTVEEKVLALQNKKKSVIDAALDTDDHAMQNLTWEDVQDLLTL